MLTTERLEELTRSVAASLGLSNARIVVIPHPLGGTDPAVVESWADDAVDRTIELLTSNDWSSPT
ncbi:MAG: hypothetical protein IH940_10905 [Acidobacteria bacterium]|nr:hypothetical protein [Acidobacteriota bacterium]